MPGTPPDQRGPVLFLVLLAIVAVLVIAWGVGREQANGAPAPVDEAPSPAVLAPTEAPGPVERPEPEGAAPRAVLPGGGTPVFGADPDTVP